MEICPDLLSHKTCRVQYTLAKLYKQYCYQKYYLFYSHFSCLQNGVLLKPPNVAWITQLKHRIWLAVTANPHSAALPKIILIPSSPNLHHLATARVCLSVLHVINLCVYVHVCKGDRYVLLDPQYGSSFLFAIRKMIHIVVCPNFVEYRSVWQKKYNFAYGKHSDCIRKMAYNK